jgi:hypothetical protein
MFRTEALDKAFVQKTCPTFGDLIAKLGEDWTLSEVRARDMVSGLRRISKVLGCPPKDLPADSRWLQPRLARVAPAAFGLTQKSWANAISNARSAMAHFGIVERRRNHLDDLDPEWHRLWTTVLVSRDPTLRPALGRFVYFLSRMGVDPDEVSNEHAEAYRNSLVVNEISKSPEVAYRAAVNGLDPRRQTNSGVAPQSAFSAATQEDDHGSGGDLSAVLL